jgi:hypothetical protein
MHGAGPKGDLQICGLARRFAASSDAHQDKSKQAEISSQQPMCLLSHLAAEWKNPQPSGLRNNILRRFSAF